MLKSNTFTPYADIPSRCIDNNWMNNIMDHEFCQSNRFHCLCLCEYCVGRLRNSPTRMLRIQLDGHYFAK